MCVSITEALFFLVQRNLLVPALCFIAGTVCFIVQRPWASLCTKTHYLLLAARHPSLTEAAYVWGFVWESQACHWLHCVYGYFYQLRSARRNNRLRSCSKSLMQHNLANPFTRFFFIIENIWAGIQKNFRSF